MGDVRLNRALRAKIGYWLSLILIICGVYFVSNLGSAMIVAGVLGALSFLVLVETDDREGSP